MNTGAGCATAVTGVSSVTVVGEPTPRLDISWSLPPARVIRPSERFQFGDGITIPRSSITWLFPTQVQWRSSTRFSWRDVQC